MKSLVLFGAPGSGKGTQSERLVKEGNYFHISTGNLLREAIRESNSLGQKAKAYMDRGELVPDQVVIDLVAENLSLHPSQPFVLDGFPRTVAQADAMLDILSKIGRPLDLAVFLEVPTEVLKRRLTGRRVSASGQVYHIDFKPPRRAGFCDLDGSELEQRSDDTPEVVQERLATYALNTAPLVDYFKNKGMYFQIDGNRGENQVFADLKSVVNTNESGHKSSGVLRSTSSEKMD